MTKNTIFKFMKKMKEMCMQTNNKFKQTRAEVGAEVETQSHHASLDRILT